MEAIYTDWRKLPDEEVAFEQFISCYPRYRDTSIIDRIRSQEYEHLDDNGQVCLDYAGVGLFSYLQQSMGMAGSNLGLCYISANLATRAMYEEDGTTESYIRKRILRHMNIDEKDYCIVFTVNSFSALKLLCESYPFHQAQNLLLAYDYQYEPLDWIQKSAHSKKATVMTANLCWPDLKIDGEDLRRKLQGKKKLTPSKMADAKGLFAYPFSSRVTGTRNSLQWIVEARQNGWHVLLDISNIGAKTVDSLGLSFFLPDFIICSFYKVFGHDPTGFGCLVIKRSVLQSLGDSSRARAIGMVRIVSKQSASVTPAGSPRPVSQSNGVCSTCQQLSFPDDGDSTPSVSSFSASGSPVELSNPDAFRTVNRTCNCRPEQGAKNIESAITTMIEEPGLVSDLKEVSYAQQNQSAALSPALDTFHTIDSPFESARFHYYYQRDAASGMRPGVGSNEGSLGKEIRSEILTNNGISIEQPTDACKVEDTAECLTSFLTRSRHQGDEEDGDLANLLSFNTGVEESSDGEARELKAANSSLHHSENFHASSSTPSTSDQEENDGVANVQVARLSGSSPSHSSFSLSGSGSPLWTSAEEDACYDGGNDTGPVMCRGLDQADKVGLTRIAFRQRSLINWLISSLSCLRHPQLDGHKLVVMYGPPIKKTNHGATIAFNLVDSHNNFLNPDRVQTLADRYNISLRKGVLEGMFVVQHQERVKESQDSIGTGCAELASHKRRTKGEAIKKMQLPVLYAALGFLTNFSDVYRLWVFVARFLDSEFVKQELWHYQSLNQEMIVI